MSNSIRYTGKEALEITKSFYPNTWKEIIDSKIAVLERIMKVHNIGAIKAYKKFVIAGCSTSSNIEMFAALHTLLLNTPSVAKRINDLEDKRQKTAEQLFALENNTIISYEERTKLRGYYVQLQQATTQEIKNLLHNIEVIEPELIVSGLFGNTIL
jgi:hypothetical protein